MKKGDPVKVYWVDSISSSGWNTYEDDMTMACETTGFFYKKTKDRVVVALDRYLGDDDNYGQFGAIPLVAVKKIVKLKE